MNYKERIEALHKKGILDLDQAQRLDEALHAKDSASMRRVPRRWTIELVGLALVALLFAVLYGAGSRAAAAMPSPQNVAETLNAPLEAGIDVSSTAWLLAALFAAGLYLLFYLLVRRSYGRKWKIHHEIQRCRNELDAAKNLQEELTPALERIRAEASDRATQQKSLLAYDGDEAMLLAMRTQKELLERIAALQTKIARLEAQDARYDRGIWAALAPLVGPLPKKEEL